MPELLTPLRQIIRSRSTLADLLESLPYLQAHCQHPHVAHSMGSDLLPVRICLRCGLEEAGSAYSDERYWSRRQYDGLSKLGNLDGRSVQTMAPLDYQRIRVTA